MKKMVLTALFAVTSLSVVPALADDAKGQRPSFPMPAATFREHVQARVVKMRERTEKRASTLTAEQAKELRAKTEAGIAQMNAEVQKAVADGTVTAEEAKAVRAAGPHGKGGHCEGKDKTGAKT